MIEAFVVGRIGVDLTPSRPRTTLAAADGFIRSVGGFAGNIGFGLARLGIATAVVSSVGPDGHGDHVRAALAGEGIDVSALTVQAGSRTQVAFFEAWPPDDFPVTFYRPEPAPDSLIRPVDVPLAALQEARLVIVSGTLLAAEPARSTTLAILAARKGAGQAAGKTAGETGRSGRPGSWTIVDLDWRPALWADPGEYPALIGQALALGDVVIGSDSEFAAAAVRPDDLAADGPGIVVLKHGQDGVSLLTSGEVRSIPGIAVEVTCALGAGDALTAAFAAGLLRGLEALAALERGNAAGAIVASRLMCSTAMPRPAEIDALIAGRPARPMEARR